MRSKVSIRRLKEILSLRRDALRRALYQDLTGLRTGVGIDIGDSVDQAVDDEFDHVSSQLAQTESRELEQIEEALRRMKKGNYGLCEGCGEAIPLARLQVVPYAKRCVRCQRASERHSTEPASRIDWSTVRDEESDNAGDLYIDRVMDVG